ncbi:MAG: terminase gpA endonuclease subunit [Bryobacteraceae bacterium]
MDASERIQLALLEAARAAAPPPNIGITEWAEQNRILGNSSRLGGPYRSRMTPFWRLPQELLSPRSPIQRVIIQKAAQCGGTEIALNTIGFYMAVAASPILAVQPTIVMAQKFSRQRLSELLTLSPMLADLMATPRGGERSNSLLVKSGRNGSLLMLAGANAPSALRSLPIKVLVLDEVDSYPGDVGGEGDPVLLASARTESFGSLKKILAISTPTIKFASRIESLYEASDRRRYYVPCPHCANRITLEFEQLYLELGVANHRCQVCGAGIAEQGKRELLESGEWRATATSSDAATAGFHISQIYSPWSEWRDLLARHDAAKTPETQQVFVNCSLGRSWALPIMQIPDADVLRARSEPYAEGIAPKGACLLTAGVDCQPDRLEIEVIGWGRDAESWSIGYYTIHGAIDQPEVWSQLDTLLSRSWPHISGMPMSLQAVAIDAGYATPEVAQFCRSRHGRRIYATKSLAGGWRRPIWPRRASWTKDRMAIYSISADEAKAWTASRLRIEEPGPGFTHFPVTRPRDWFEMLTAERLVIDKGERRWTNPLRLRNEATDARMLAVAALHSRLLAGVDLNRWCEEFDAMLAPPLPNGPPPRVNGPAVSRSRFVYG